jgi:hypothetical protein
MVIFMDEGEIPWLLPLSQQSIPQITNMLVLAEKEFPRLLPLTQELIRYSTHYQMNFSRDISDG